MTPTMLPIDWVRVLDDIAWCLGEPDFAFPDTRQPLCKSALAERLGVSRGSLRRWIEDGAEPRHCDGEMVLATWCRVTGKTQAFAPRAARTLSAAKVD